MLLDCANIETIKDVTDQIDYIDRNGDEKKIDPKLVSCGQSKDDELKDKYDEYFSQIKESDIAKIMCRCCKKLKPTGKEKVKWLEFYKCMKKYFNIENHPITMKKLNELIEWHTQRS